MSSNFGNSCTPWSSSAGVIPGRPSRPQTTPRTTGGHGGPVIDSPTCRCSHPMDPVFNARTGRCNAWYCPSCGRWDAALYREKQITWAHWDIVTDADYYPLPVDGEPDKPDAQREDAHV